MFFWPWQMNVQRDWGDGSDRTLGHDRTSSVHRDEAWNKKTRSLEAAHRNGKQIYHLKSGKTGSLELLGRRMARVKGAMLLLILQSYDLNGGYSSSSNRAEEFPPAFGAEPRSPLIAPSTSNGIFGIRNPSLESVPIRLQANILRATQSFVPTIRQ